jgi:hypothetical protein
MTCQADQSMAPTYLVTRAQSVNVPPISTPMAQVMTLRSVRVAKHASSAPYCRRSGPINAVFESPAPGGLTVQPA